MRTHLFILIIVLFCAQLCAQTGYTQKFGTDPGGERDAKVFPYRSGILQTSTLPMNGGNILRRVNNADSVTASLVLDNEFLYYFHPVPVTNGNIFVFGTDTFAGFTEVHFVILDSNLNPIIQKKVALNFIGVGVRFSRAIDGGVIGVIQQSCAYSRIFRMDALGNVIWVKTYVSQTATPYYTPAFTNDIYLYGGNKYMLVGAHFLGAGLCFTTIDDDGNLLNSTTVETPLGDYWADIPTMSVFDGEKVCVLTRNIYGGPDSSYVTVVDTGMNVLMLRQLPTASAQIAPLTIVSTPQDFIVAVTTDYGQTGASVLVTGFDKATMTSTWAFTTLCDGSPDSYFMSLDGVCDGNGNAAFCYNYGGYNAGWNFSEFGVTRLDPVTHAGFCDAIPVTTSCPAIPIVSPVIAMDTFHILPCTTTISAYNMAPGVITSSQLACGVITEIAVTTSEVSYIYPNPTAGLCRLNTYYTVVVTDISGRVVVSGYTDLIDLTPFASGIYNATLENERGAILYQKIIRE